MRISHSEEDWDRIKRAEEKKLKESEERIERRIDEEEDYDD